MDTNTPNICLRVVDHIDEDCDTTKTKSSRGRGRPRKISGDITVASKTHKKKSLLTETDVCDKSIHNTVIPPTSYIVQLKVRSKDLLKIQKQFVDNVGNSNFGNNYNFGNNCIGNDRQVIKDNGICEEEYKLIIDSIENTESRKYCDLLPQIPNIYQNIVIPVLESNVPIKLFDKDYENDKSLCENNRITNEMLLPLVCDHGQWAMKSPYACWNCDSYFTGTPIGIPDKENNGKFYCYGNFCSFECAARYLMDHENTIDYWNKYSLLCQLYQIAYKLPPDSKVTIAPPKETLTKYGGKLSYDEYHKTNLISDAVTIYKLPLIPVQYHMDINYHAIHPTPTTLIRNQKHISIDPQKLILAEENIKKKNDERLKSTYTLIQCLKK